MKDLLRRTCVTAAECTNGNRFSEGGECRCPNNKYLTAGLECVTDCTVKDLMTMKCTNSLDCTLNDRALMNG
jgi:hypothetical protein